MIKFKIKPIRPIFFLLTSLILFGILIYLHNVSYPVKTYSDTNYYKVTSNDRAEYERSRVERYKYEVLNSLDMSNIDTTRIDLPNSIITTKDKSKAFAFVKGPGSLLISDKGDWIFSVSAGGASTTITNLYTSLTEEGYKQVYVVVDRNVEVFNPSNLQQVIKFTDMKEFY